MSFDHNPYEHIEVVRRSPTEFAVYCHSCGGERPKPKQVGLAPTTSLAEVFEVAAEHIRVSHGRSPADFASWSIY